MNRPAIFCRLTRLFAAVPLLLAVAGCGDNGPASSNNNGGDGSVGDSGVPDDGAVNPDGSVPADSGQDCGNHFRENTEQCDGPDLGGQTCAGLGHEGGPLGCAANCTFDESRCYDDPVVFRAADQAEVCSSTPQQDCTLADMGFVLSEYGSTLERGDDAGGTRAVYRLMAFVERLGPSNIDVLVTDRNGAPLAGVPVAFYWPDAPETSRPDEWYPKKVTTTTGANGIAGFALGGGAYLPCCGCGGPHAVWVSDPGPTPDTTVPTDLADHLGMLGNTNHRHLDLIFQKVDPPPAPGPTGAVRCPLQ